MPLRSLLRKTPTRDVPVDKHQPSTLKTIIESTKSNKLSKNCEFSDLSEASSSPFKIKGSKQREVDPFEEISDIKPFTAVIKANKPQRVESLNPFEDEMDFLNDPEPITCLPGPTNEVDKLSLKVNESQNTEMSDKVGLSQASLAMPNTQSSLRTDVTEGRNDNSETIERFTTKNYKFTMHIFNHLYESLAYAENVEDASQKIIELNKIATFGDYPPNVIIKTHSFCILSHIQVLSAMSNWMSVRIKEWFDKRADYPIIDLTDYDYIQTRACIWFFYTLGLEIDHKDISPDLGLLVNLFNNPILKSRYIMIKEKYNKYKLYQYGVVDAYSRKTHRRIEHRGNTRIGDDSRDTESIISGNLNRDYPIDRSSSRNSIISKDPQSDIVCPSLTNLSTANSHHNPLLNCNSKMKQLAGREMNKCDKNPFA